MSAVFSLPPQLCQEKRGGSELAAQVPQWAGEEGSGNKETASHRTVIILCWVQGMGNPTCLPVCPSSSILLQSMFASASHIHSQCEPQETRATLGLGLPSLLSWLVGDF